MRLIDADKLERGIMFYDYKEHVDFSDDLIEIIDDVIRVVIDRLHEQPTIDDWIPVSERLPERHEPVLVMGRGFKENSHCRMVATYYEEWVVWNGYELETLRDVTAWQPLPEPYRGGAR